MKFGKRRQAADAPQAPDAPGYVADSSAAPPRDTFADSWTVPAEQAPPPAQPAYEKPVAYEPEQPVSYEPEPVVHEEPVVEGEAVELPIEHVPAQPYLAPLTMRQPQAAMPFPAGEAPVVVVTADGEPAQVSSLSDAGEAYASGHAAARHGASPGPSWQEPVIALANERPEVVVGAAFAGGILAAMILRRLGN